MNTKLGTRHLGLTVRIMLNVCLDFNGTLDYWHPVLQIYTYTGANKGSLSNYLFQKYEGGYNLSTYMICYMKLFSILIWFCVAQHTGVRTRYGHNGQVMFKCS